MSKNVVAQTLGLGLNDGTADVCFLVGDQQIQTHKQVLIQSCRYFDAMFQAHWTECNKTNFTVDQFSYDTFYAFLKYIYTDELVPGTHWENLADLADYYGHDLLQGICRMEMDLEKEDEEG